jgi:hypothetical protein
MEIFPKIERMRTTGAIDESNKSGNKAGILGVFSGQTAFLNRRVIGRAKERSDIAFYKLWDGSVEEVFPCSGGPAG